MAPDDLERARAALRAQAVFARGDSPLASAMLKVLLNWIDDANQSDPLRARLVQFVLGPVEGGWVHALEPTQRLAGVLHDKVLSGDPRVDSIRPYYRTVGGNANPFDPALRDHLLTAASAVGMELFDRAETWRVQSNDPARGFAWLLPAAILGVEAAYLVELGASAGLNLYAEQRAYSLVYGDGAEVRFGRAEAEQFRIAASGSLGESRAEHRRGPEVRLRVGCDMRPIDLSQPAEERGLCAECWGDDAQQLLRVKEGIELHKRAVAGGLPAAEVQTAVLPDDLSDFLDRVLPTHPEVPVIAFNTCVTTYLADVHQRAVYRTMMERAKSWSVRHGLPWMWVRFEPARVGEPAGAHAGWCRWRVELFVGAAHRQVELGWAHPQLRAAEFGPGLSQLERMRE